MKNKVTALTTIAALVAALLIAANAFSAQRTRTTLAAIPTKCSDPSSVEGLDGFLVSVCVQSLEEEPTPTETPTLEPTPTETASPSGTETGVPPETETPSPTFTDTPSPTDTLAPSITPSVTVTHTPSYTPTAGNFTPVANAPLCPSHDPAKWHGLWDSARGCHYDHEHGTSPFAVLDTVFSDFNYNVILCGLEISHCNPSSHAEHEVKHGGYKWQAESSAANGCVVGFEGGTVAVDAYAIQYHAFGPQQIEFETPDHSAISFMRQCKPGNPNDKGYLIVAQLQRYGEVVMPYQGLPLPYPYPFTQRWDAQFAPYFSIECEGNSFTWQNPFTGQNESIACRTPGDTTSNNLTTWTSKRPAQSQIASRPPMSAWLGILFRGRDMYQRVVVTNGVPSYPFDFTYVCGNANYIQAGCEHNNSTTTVHELQGNIPAALDNLVGFDSDPRVGRITGSAYLTRYGDINTSCVEADGLDCQVLIMVNAFVGKYSTDLCAVKCNNSGNELFTPERDIYFCNGAVCSETDPSAVPSGWIGSGN